MSISKEAIEAAARALFAVENCDRRQMLDVESNWRGRLNDANREEYRILATAALTAAAPYIQAAALRDAARELNLPGSTDVGYYSGYTDSGYSQAETDAENWLITRAVELEGGKL